MTRLEGTGRVAAMLLSSAITDVTYETASNAEAVSRREAELDA
jgi:hypothetical protein